MSKRQISGRLNIHSARNTSTEQWNSNNLFYIKIYKSSYKKFQNNIKIIISSAVTTTSISLHLKTMNKLAKQWKNDIPKIYGFERFLGV